MSTKPDVKLKAPQARAFTIPTDAPEADGTLSWDRTTLIVVDIDGGGETGLGYAYAHGSAVTVINETLAPLVDGLDAFAPEAAWDKMVRAVRNMGWPGIAAGAISAVDVALWDLKAKLLGVSLAELLGIRRDRVDIYGSGGFTSYSDRRLVEQLGGWVDDDGCRAVKMKIGSEPARDPTRMETARAAIGTADLYIDANGAFTPRQALSMAATAEEFDVTWFEEPVSSDDLDGLTRVRDGAPDTMDIAAGEYGYQPFYFRHMLEAGAVDVLQADATRCGGVTGFMKAADIADSFMTPLSAHTAPALHCHLGAAAPRFRNIEWFHDHVRIEHMLFDGAPQPQFGTIAPDRDRAGLGLIFKAKDAEAYAA